MLESMALAASKLSEPMIAACATEPRSSGACGSYSSVGISVGVGISEGCDTSCSDWVAALGVRVRKWVTYHGIAINVHPDLSHYSGIVPCGIREHGVTSLKALGIDATLADVDAALKATFEANLGSD